MTSAEISPTSRLTPERLEPVAEDEGFAHTKKLIELEVPYNLVICIHIYTYIYILVGGFNPFEKYDRQIGSFPQVGMKIKHI